ncbi:MAG TPA: zinc-dependent metalloprotease [Candidatus Rubrimentiphilum sp.]|nr:zinc-dependent metalloprotease [Candidatus Rubrimentiphilum sp.]
MTSLFRIILGGFFVLALAAPASAQNNPPPSAANQAAAMQAAAAAAAQAGQPAPYDVFVRGATVQDGLIPIIHKAGRVYLAIKRSQLGADFIQTAVPSSGLGGLGPAQGEPYVAPARLLRFEKVEDTVVVRWPNTYTITRPNTPEATGVQQSLPSSVIAVVPIAAADDTTVVIPASFLLGDVADFDSSLNFGPPSPGAYRLDASRSFFSVTKAFPENDVLRVDQTWTSAAPNFSRIDNAPDARSIEVLMTYNFIQAPSDGYVPRIADPRIGYFTQPLVNFSTDQVTTGRTVHYIMRWNFGKRTSSAPMHATNPLVMWLSNDIPYQYRTTVRNALLTWNNAFKKIGILDAVQVRQQPNDPSWDPEDIRHNMLRWLNTTSPAFGAEALLVTDPRTGEELNIGVNFDAVEGLAGRTYRYIVAPARGIPDSAAAENQFVQDLIGSVILHESGHNFGLQHNFIGTMAYTPKQMQSKAFTSRYGVSNSVMEYSPVNLWPKGTPQGDYFQTALGPYDYYAIRYGYGYIPGATTPNAELPTLRRWASLWSNPWYRFASDEDNSHQGGHAIDPRVVTYDLTNHPLEWCDVQMKTMHNVMNAVSQRFPAPGHSFDEARQAFTAPLTTYLRCASMPANWIGGEYLSRAAKGDPGANAPLTPVSLADEHAAWTRLADGLFSEAAWHFNPSVLNKLTYSEYGDFVGASWAYNPSPRHDVAVTAIINAQQNQVLSELFAPLTLQRIDDLQTKYSPGATMSLTNLFDWSRQGIFGDLTGGINSAGPIRRNLQIAFAKRLADMWVNPAPGTPADAQALARMQLQQLRQLVAAGLQRGGLSELTRAHLEALGVVAQQALNAQAIIVPSGLIR